MILPLMKKKQYDLWDNKQLTSAEYSRAYRERRPDAAARAQAKYRATHREEIRKRRYERYHKNIALSRKHNKEKARKWRAAAQGGFHKYRLNRYYGPSAADHYAKKYEEQSGKC